MVLRHVVRGVVVAVVTPLFVDCALGKIQQHHMKTSDKVVYEKSQWDENLIDAEKETIIGNRQPIIQTLQNLFGMKPYNVDDITHLFADDIIYEDPIIRSVGQRELFIMFSLLSKVWKETKANNFDAVHSQDCIHISHDRDITFVNGQTFSISSTLVVKLEKDGTNEKIKFLTDEWDDRSLLGPDNSKFLGNVHVLTRRLHLKFAFMYIGAKHAFRSFMN